MEDQTSASPEELETPSNAPSAGDESGADAAPEGGAKSGRTLKLKASEASNEASAGEAAEPQQRPAQIMLRPTPIQTVKTARLRGDPVVDGNDGHAEIPIPPALTP